jgi:hypothetical protein
MLWQQSKRAADELGPADNGIIRAELIGCDTAVALGHTVATHTPVNPTVERVPGAESAPRPEAAP